MKDIESQAFEYAEALNDIADLLDMPTGASPADIAQAAKNKWASGIHSCHDHCQRPICILRRERDQLTALVGTIRQYLPIPIRNVKDITPEQHDQEIGSAIKAIIQERDQLARCKQEHLTVESWWNEIDKAVREHPDTILGDTIAHTALRFIRERDSEAALADELADAVKSLRNVIYSMGGSGNMGMTALTKHAVARRDKVLGAKFPRKPTSTPT